MGESGCQISVFNKMLCKIPQEAEKNQPVDYLVETEENSIAGFPSEPPGQVLLQTQTPGLFQIQLFVSFLLILETLFTTTGIDTEISIF